MTSFPLKNKIDNLVSFIVPLDNKTLFPFDLFMGYAAFITVHFSKIYQNNKSNREISFYYSYSEYYM